MSCAKVPAHFSVRGQRESLCNCHCHCPTRVSVGSPLALEGPFPVMVDPLDTTSEHKVVCALIKELNDCYCLSLPTDPLLDRHSESPARDLSEKRLVILGSS